MKRRQSPPGTSPGDLGRIDGPADQFLAPMDWTGHSSVLGNLRLIANWNSKRAYLSHYSGYEDTRECARRGRLCCESK